MLEGAKYDQAHFKQQKSVIENAHNLAKEEYERVQNEMQMAQEELEDERRKLEED